jgi:flap endonuclease-1
MGIKYLNRYLTETCTNSAIKHVHLSNLSGKRIAIDTSIYLYKYTEDDGLIEKFYLMISIFKYYNIIPLFIFDGKPPDEKKELLQKRRAKKLEAEIEYNLLKESLNSKDSTEKQKIVADMNTLKKDFIYISKQQINKIKELITSYGASYYDAEGEADEVCASLVIKKIVYACLSEDMDMFVYGVNRVLKHFSLTDHTVVQYDLKKILSELKLSFIEFKQICVLSGTDYNVDCETDLYKTLKLFKRYKRWSTKDNFYVWIHKNCPENIENMDALLHAYNLFELSNNNYNKIRITNSKILRLQLNAILEEDGFIFL